MKIKNLKAGMWLRKVFDSERLDFTKETVCKTIANTASTENLILHNVICYIEPDIKVLATTNKLSETSVHSFSSLKSVNND